MKRVKSPSPESLRLALRSVTRPRSHAPGSGSGIGRMNRTVLLVLTVVLIVFPGSLVPVRAASPPQPTGVSLLHRSGQTFVTWLERGAITGEKYRIYRHNQPITRLSLHQATLLREVAEGSGRFFADRYNVDSSGVWRARYVARFVIRNRGAQLPANTGLLVWTLGPEDFGGENSGAGYYAVTTVAGNGTENVTDFSSANALGPVNERVSDPKPVEILRDDTGRGHVYTQFMDLRHWNATFHAPNADNLYYGLDPGGHGVSGAIQYAYTYTVGEPDPANCPASLPVRFPVILNLHGWGDNSYGPDPGASQYYCAFEIRPIDVSETWWFGFARNHDYRKGGTVKAGDVIANFTEERVLRMVHDLLQDPAFKPRIDPRRVYAYGHSMGGSGALALAMRYPDVFAACYASEPMTNYVSSTLWRGDLTPKWGGPALNLPVEIRAPSNWAAGLRRYNGMGVWDWQNHRANFRNRDGDEFVPFGVAHGRADDVIDWPTQGRPAYAAFDGSRRAWGGAVTNSDHSWLNFEGLPPALGQNNSLVPFAGLRAIRNESVPGLSEADGNLPLPPPGPSGPLGGYNQTIDWSASWHPWDGTPIDTSDLWGISLRTTDGSTQTVNVTPRRARSFKSIAGRSYRWENRRASDNRVTATGTVVADGHGLVTIPDFRVTSAGNRLRISPLRSWPDTTLGIHVFNDQLAAGMSDQQVRFAATHYAGTQKMTRVEADRLRTLNPAFIILHYRLGHGLGYRATDGDCRPVGSWLRVVEGDNWVVEWPGAGEVEENWFHHRPSSSTTRVLNCDWGWYLMELNDGGFRSYWHGEVLRQVRANDDDGVFMDSLSVPNYLGADRYDPHLPAYNESFERAWAARITNWLKWLRGRPLGHYYLVPNVGSWITTRETTDYSPADGLMIEGFAIDADASPYAYDDWKLQMNRIVAATKRGQAILAQTYVSGGRERMFATGSYLLVKGRKSFLNIDLGLDPEWWPEYDIPIGRPVESATENISELDANGDKIYRRRYDNGLVLVNPTCPWDGSGVTRTLNFRTTSYLAQTSGGGTVPPSGIPTGSVTYRAVTSVRLPPYSAAVLPDSLPSGGWPGDAQGTGRQLESDLE